LHNHCQDSNDDRIEVPGSVECLREEPAEVVTTNSDTDDPILEDGFILTLDNYLSIDPMIGIREEDIKDIFKK